MNLLKRLRLFFWTICLLTGSAVTGWGQTPYTITGVVTDARTGEPVPFASVALVGRHVGTMTDERGQYVLKPTLLTDSIAVSSLGYATQRRDVNRALRVQTIDVTLVSAGMALQEVTVRAGENPAFRVLRQVRKNRILNDRNRLSAYEYDSYVKTEIAFSRVADKSRKNPLLRRINRAMSRLDSLTDDEGSRLLPVLVSESVSRYYFRDKPQLKREEVRKTRIKGVAVGDAEFSSQLLGGTGLVNQNFYDNYIPILGKDFASPIGEHWKGNYEFFLADTLQIGDRICYELHFDPKRPEDLVFTGKAWIDTLSFALCQIEARIGKGANINYVRSLTIEQELEPTLDSTVAGSTATAGWLPVGLRLTADLTGVGPRSLGVRGRVTLRNSNIRVNQPRPTTFFDQPYLPSDTVRTLNDTYWNTVGRTLAGPDSLNRDDRKARLMIDSLRNVPMIRRAEAIGQILATGYYKTGGIDWGPLPYLAAVNSVEGLRMRVGFRTNEDFSRSWVLRGYMAYGTLDQRVKYGAEVDYIISRRRWTMLGARLTSDLERLGLTPELMGNNRILYAMSRFGRYRGAYRNDQFEVFLRTEPIKGILLSGSYGTRRMTPTFPFHYRLQPELEDQSPLQSDMFDAYWSVEARLARKEKYILDGNERITLGTKRAPVLTIRYTHGAQRLGGQFNYDKITLRAQQSFRLGMLGRTSYLLSAGFIPSTLPAPLLFPHIGNPTPFFSINTFNRMQFYEFTSDRFVAIHVQHKFEGLLFNRIPGIRKLNWRLVANADALWGSQTPANKAVETFKELPNGLKPIHFGALNGATPYLELGYGIDNIFKVLRIQAIHRLTYLDSRPGGQPVAPFIVKAAASFSF